MNSSEDFKAICLLFDQVVELPHFEKTSFRVSGKIFATFDEQKATACIKLSEVDQSVFCDCNKDAIYAVPNKWGKQGWTMIDLEKVNDELLHDALRTAYCTVAPKKLADIYKSAE
ncbi:MmcQ/YjbR family DNA-binding protein [Pedobacter sp. HMF7647]|uniref:MmcQ/YjbR family DNA-binding protein n=1 Tax=Hufsiella arboris TaxID=2695275 RepID=A0A7K1YEL7_9SPHI|nr:MmcQ/YjbR family DNA-binding protein [Hufsiella arboris]MXV53057.1 MmcQ/YjbR family DNA-binding protein [Hufsiella arboris]